ncbi:MAG TPA: hypothetical protein VMV34_08105 [Terriglobia bacterium]|nr:hypothetical protein [Terriglobia bacterium]
MKHLLWGVLICLASLPLLQGQEQRPTLGPSEPSLHGPSSAKTTDQRRLLTIRKIYVERIDNKLSDKIMEELSKSSMLRIVDKQDDADAILRGTCFQVRRLKRLHSEVYLSDRTSGSSIWQDIVLVPWNPPSLNNAVDQSAAKIVTHLFESIQRAEK